MEPLSTGGLLGLSQILGTGLILLVGLQHLERREWDRERRELLQRIERASGAAPPPETRRNRTWSDPREARLARERDLDGA